MSDEDSRGKIIKEIFELARRKWEKERLLSLPGYFWKGIVLQFTDADTNCLSIVRVLASKQFAGLNDFRG